MPRTEVHLDDNRWLIRTSIRDTAPMRLIAGARAKPSDLLEVAEWTVPATVETAKQLKFTFPGAVWLPEAKAHRGLLASLRKERIGLQEDRDPRKLETPTGTKELAPFQALGVDWLFGVSGVLADDMGLGKTVQLSVAAQRHALYKFSSLVLCPVAALGVWEQHLTEWTDIKPFRFHGPSRAKALTAFHDY
ncbi:MAG: hypothetical protein GY937_21940, partial [bacterium]|nr:hypothetical protein [bacterium]